MTFAITIAASGTYDITSDTARITHLAVTNNGPGIVYYGDIPPADLSFNVNADTGSAIVTMESEAAASAVQPGMVISDESNAFFTAGTTVLSVKGNQLTVSAVALDTIEDLTATFTAPAISSTNGHPLQLGETRLFTAGEMAAINQHGRRLVADASGAVLVITKQRS